MAKQYEILGLHRLNHINLIDDFSEIGQELSEKLLNACKTKWHATFDKENNIKLRTYLLFKRKFASEPYLEMPITRKERKELAQTTCRVAQLRVAGRK